MKKNHVWRIFGFLLMLLAAGNGDWLHAGPPQPATADQIKEMITAAGDANEYEKADVLYVLDEADVYVQKSGLATTVSCQVIKILTDAGVRSQAVQRWEFDPATNRLTIKAARIHRKDGTVEDVPVSDLITQPARQWMIYWGNRQHLLPLPRVAVGDCIELRTSKTGYNIAYLDGGGAAASGETLVPPMEGHWYEVTLFQSYDPILNKRYTVHMPQDMSVQFGVYNGSLQSSMWYDGERNVYTWSAEKIPAIKKEPHMVALDDCAIKLVMATVPDWETKSRWFHAANEGQFAADDAIRAKVRELTEGLADDEAKIAACLNWVADNIRYYGTSRGACEGFTLHASTETFHDRGGVCKDKAGMLVTMLRVLGHEAYPALTMAGSRVEAIPADQFNHTVTAIRNPDGTFRVLDPTWSPMSRELWSSREARQALVFGTPEGRTLTLSPYFEPAYNLLEATSDGAIGEHGELSTRIVMNLKGYPCTYLRRTLGGQPKPEQHAVLERALNVAPNTRIDALEVTDPYDYSRDGHLDLSISADRYAAGTDAVRMFHLPLMAHPFAEFLMPDLLYSVEPEKREYGMRLRATRLVRYQETLKLPPDWRVNHMPKARKLDFPVASLTFDASSLEGKLTYRFEIAVKEHIITTKDYPEYRKVIQAMKDIASEWIVCTIGAEKAELAEQTPRDEMNRKGGSR